MSAVQEPSLLIVDGFLPNFPKIRAAATTQSFGTVEYEGYPYDGVGLGLPIEQSPLVLERLSRVVGFPVRVSMAFWRLGLANDRVTSWIHADSSCDRFAGVYYACEPPELGEFGTAMWHHRELGMDRLPLDLKDPEALSTRLVADSHNDKAWRLVDLAGLRPNRLVVYPTRRFHSRYPREAWGDSASTGRLIWTCFFDRET